MTENQGEKWPKVAIIVLNWNGWRDTIECLESLYQITYPNYEVIVVDNGSEDDSIDKIKEYCGGKIKVESKFFDYSSDNKPIKTIEYTREDAEAGGGEKEEIIDLPSNQRLIIIKNEKNHGFAEGNNIGMRYALKALHPDYVLLLNNDTVVGKGFLVELVKVAESDDKIGIVGPKIYYYDDEKLWFSGAKILFWRGGIPKGFKETNQIKNVDMIIGCCMLIKKEVIEITEMLDPVYFFGWEDADFCMRTKKLGYRTICTPKGEIWHKTGKSYGGCYYSDPHILRESIRNQLIFMSRYASFSQKLLSIPYIFMYVIFLIFFRSKTFDNIKIKIIAITSGFVDFIEYKKYKNY